MAAGAEGHFESIQVYALLRIQSILIAWEDWLDNLQQPKNVPLIFQGVVTFGSGAVQLQGEGSVQQNDSRSRAAYCLARTAQSWLLRALQVCKDMHRNTDCGPCFVAFEFCTPMAHEISHWLVFWTKVCLSLCPSICFSVSTCWLCFLVLTMLLSAEFSPKGQQVYMLLCFFATFNHYFSQLINEYLLRKRNLPGTLLGSRDVNMNKIQSCLCGARRQISGCFCRGQQIQE